ncbi:MAG: glycosyltransferase family 2 protein, partial [Alphaproteobacteria bacterium]|nr:glycosyltransferase family 2 protein [Alphaproteobacteria bacterium]
DADELMFPDITQEISQLLRTPDIKQYAGFFVRGGYIWDGQQLKHGLKNNKIVLLHKHRMEYPIINDLGCKIMGEIEGHYQPIPKDQKYKIGQLKTKIDHYAFVDMDDWTKRHQKYAAWEAFMITNKAYPIDPSYRRQCCKNLFRKLPFRGIIAFLHSYILKMGIIDGVAGWNFAKTRYEYYKLVRNQLHKSL